MAKFEPSKMVKDIRERENMIKLKNSKAKHKYDRMRHRSKEPKINMKLKRTLDIV